MFNFLRWLWTVGILLALPCVSHAEESREAPSSWTFEVKGGRFYPDIDDWETYFGSDWFGDIAMRFGRKVGGWLEIGVDVGARSDRGAGWLPLNDRVGGEVIYESFPLRLDAILRGRFRPGQVVIPYVGAGVERVFYQQTVHGGNDTSGAVNGHFVKAGLMLLLDRVDPRASGSLRGRYGIEHVSFIIERLSDKAEVDGVDLGGDSLLFGLAFEY